MAREISRVKVEGVMSVGGLRRGAATGVAIVVVGRLIMG